MKVRRPNTAYLTFDDAETPRVCSLKPKVGVDAAVLATQGNLCAACFEKMTVHDVETILEHFSRFNDNSRGNDIKSARGQRQIFPALSFTSAAYRSTLPVMHNTTTSKS